MVLDLIGVGEPGSRRRKRLRAVLHAFSVSPLALTLGFVALHFHNLKQAAFFFSIFALTTAALPLLLRQIVKNGPVEELAPELVVFVDKDPGRLLPMYVLPFVIFANAKTEDVGLLVFVAGLIASIMNGPLSLQTHPGFWLRRWRIYSITTKSPGDSSVKMGVFVLSSRRIAEITGPLAVVRVSAAFFVDAALFPQK